MNIKKSKISDIVKGVIFGQAIGDAVGVQAEFCFKKDFKSVDDIKFPMTEQVKIFEKNDWTDDTDQAILLMESVVAAGENRVSIEEFNKKLQKIFAEKLIFWTNNGFPELGDKNGQGCGGLTLTIKNSHNFLNNPAEISRKIWIDGKKNIAPNGAIMRAAASLFLLCDSFSKIDGFEDRPHSIFFSTVAAAAETTHYDIRCIISAVFLNALLLQISIGIDLCNLRKNAFEDTLTFIKNNEEKFADHFPELQIEKERSIVPKFYVDEKYFKNGKYNYSKELFDYCYFNYPLQANENMGNKSWISSLELDKPGRIGYTFKCMSCAAWAAYLIEEYVSDKNKIRQVLDFKKIIKYVAHFGGDADTNCSVVGAVLGAFFGFEVLEELAGDWIAAMPHSAWLEKRVDTAADFK